MWATAIVSRWWGWRTTCIAYVIREFELANEYPINHVITPTRAVSLPCSLIEKVYIKYTALHQKPPIIIKESIFDWDVV